MGNQEVIISEDIEKELTAAISRCVYDKLFVLVDKTTEKNCLPLVSGLEDIKKGKLIVIGSTDVHKTLETLAYVWTELGNCGGTRHSLLVIIGGGMVTDLGGFAA